MSYYQTLPVTLRGFRYYVRPPPLPKIARTKDSLHISIHCIDVFLGNPCVQPGQWVMQALPGIHWGSAETASIFKSLYMHFPIVL